MKTRFPAAVLSDIEIKEDSQGRFFHQDIEGVVDAAVWRERTCIINKDESAALKFWIGRSTYSGSFLATSTRLSDELLARADRRWKELMNDPEAEEDEALERGLSVPGDEEYEPNDIRERTGHQGGDAEAHNYSQVVPK